MAHLQNLYTCIPIDAEFYADFKNAYFCILILLIFWVMASFRLKKAHFGENRLFRPSDGNNSKNLQDRYTKVYIFEISIKFRIEWWAGIYILKMGHIDENLLSWHFSSDAWGAYIAPHWAKTSFFWLFGINGNFLWYAARGLFLTPPPNDKQAAYLILSFW